MLVLYWQLSYVMYISGIDVWTPLAAAVRTEIIRGAADWSTKTKTHTKHEKVIVRNTSILSIRSILRPVTATVSKGARHTAGALDHRFDAGARASLNERLDHLRGC